MNNKQFDIGIFILRRTFWKDKRLIFTTIATKKIAIASVPTAMYALYKPNVVLFEITPLKLESPNGRAWVVAASDSDGISFVFTTASNINSSEKKTKNDNETEKEEKTFFLFCFCYGIENMASGNYLANLLINLRNECTFLNS